MSLSLTLDRNISRAMPINRFWNFTGLGSAGLSTALPRGAHFRGLAAEFPFRSDKTRRPSLSRALPPASWSQPCHQAATSCRSSRTAPTLAISASHLRR